MNYRQTLHIIDPSSRSRAEQARVGFGIGCHCEVYSSIAEMSFRPPRDGIVIARDDPQMGGVDAVLEALTSQGKWLPLIATSDNPRPGRVVAVVKAGALDYMRLPLDVERLQSRVARIGQEAAAHAEARRRMAEARSLIADLSPREKEVLDWLSEGRSNKEIARLLAISPRTVEVHRANMMAKLGAHHSAHAVRLCFEAQLDDAEPPERRSRRRKR